MRTILIAITCALCASAASAQNAPSPYTVDLAPDSAVRIMNLLQADIMSKGMEAAKVDMPIADQIIAAGNAAKARDKAAELKAAADKALADKPK